MREAIRTAAQPSSTSPPVERSPPRWTATPTIRIARPASSRALACIPGLVIVLVAVFESFLVRVGVGVHLVAVAVLVVVLDVIVVVFGVYVFVNGSVVVLVFVRVRMLVRVLVHRCSVSLSWVSRDCIGRVLHGARGACPDDREVRESGFVSETLSDAFADGIELLGRQWADGAATLAEEIFMLARATKRIQSGAMAKVDVAHQSVALERLEIAIDRCQVKPQEPH
jgi:hypothetical protein